MNDLTPVDPISLTLILLLIGLLPFAVIMVTSFTKLVIVFSIVRTALGLQSTPPNTVINGLALVLTCYIMYPVADDCYEVFKHRDEPKLTEMGQKEMEDLFEEVSQPFKKFLINNTPPKERKFFLVMARYIWPDELWEEVELDSFIILIPAFLLHELTEAFQIGFLLFLPFVVVDLVVSNILLAMGMMMVSPTTISLPFKLLLFVFVDGWSTMVQGLILTYR